MDSRIEVLKGDITKLSIDAIVNAANSLLMGGGGVDGAIHRAGGPKIAEECRLIREQQGGCPTGNAVLTSGGNLPARYVIHAVGPIWHGGKQNEAQLLASAYENSLKIARDKQFETIAFPNISTGVYGFPKEEASEIAIQTVNKFLSENEFPKKVIFVCFDEENYDLYLKKFQQELN
ncbi:MAG: O-acetyl-ADP-ribose deacetylase [Leptospiraceae bacterium]|nr:O-acetyl-ADP-ribose deacetylase [Leptospiraceae bacterium]